MREFNVSNNTYILSKQCFSTPILANFKTFILQNGEKVPFKNATTLITLVILRA